MSVIVAIKENGVIYMGADSQTSSGSNKIHNLNETGYKIRRLDNGMLLGFCGSIVATQTILAIKNVFTLDEDGKLTKKHIVREIIPKLVDKMEQIGDTSSGSLEVSILLVYKDQMYRISSRLGVIHLNLVAGIGAGDYYVNYYLFERMDLPVKERLLKSLVESARRTDSVGGPFVLIDSKNLEYEVIDMGGENY